MERTYSVSEKSFIILWANHWFQFADMITELLNSGRISPSGIKIDSEDVRYLKLRKWFLRHEKKLRPLWHEFFEANLETLKKDLHTENPIWVNPFIFYYRWPNIKELLSLFKLQNEVGGELVKNTQQAIRLMLTVLNRENKLVTALREWVVNGKGYNETVVKAG